MRAALPSCKDSHAECVSGKCGVTTTADTEWRFVTAPESQQEWPVEARLAERPGNQRKPLPLADLRKSLEAQNARLKSLGEPPLIVIEAFGGRLYTCAHVPSFACFLRLNLIRIARAQRSDVRQVQQVTTILFTPRVFTPPSSHYIFTSCLHASACSVAFRSKRRSGGRVSTWAA